MSSLIKSERLNCFPGNGANPEGTLPSDQVNERAQQHLDRVAKRARSVMAEARERSTAIIERALAGVDQLQEQARRQGFEAGFREGIEQGLTQAEAVRQEAEKQQEEFVEQYRLLLESAESELAKVSLELAERIVGHAISVEPALVMDMAKAVIGKLTNETAIRLRAHSDYVPLLEMRRQELVASLPGIIGVEIIADDHLSPGVIVEGKWGYVDGTLHAQLREADKVIEERLCTDSGWSKGGEEQSGESSTR